MSSILHPLLLEPILVEKPWGGRRLEAMGKRLSSEGSFGESWEVADLPDSAISVHQRGRTRVSSGELAGRVLRDLIAEFGSDFLGSTPATMGGDFPLLVKYLDAREHLSIQVHPNAEYVERDRRARLKTESWYVVAADPGAVLYLGFTQGVSAEMVEGAVGTPRLAGLLRSIPASPGGFVHVPAGTVHALGAGVVVAEIQTPSDTTFRLYDWTREYSREQREMHFEAGLAAIDIDQRPELLEPAAGEGARTLTSTEFYWLREIRGSDPLSLDPNLGVRVLLVVSGEVLVAWEGSEEVEVSRGRTLILPACVVSDIVIYPKGEVTMLEVGFPLGG